MFRIEQGGASWRVPASWTLGHPRSARLFVWFRPSYRVGSGRVPYYRVGSGRVPSYPVGSLSSLTITSFIRDIGYSYLLQLKYSNGANYYHEIIAKIYYFNLGTLAEIRNISVVLPLAEAAMP